ncbi:MAG: pyridoxamine 5'-phosphate oxidase family protein [Propionibacteriaceae bacterium]|nr:pyridoxamine 5'-phosphate oxidase family protein [Propionibacteriaceae bacterium]
MTEVRYFEHLGEEECLRLLRNTGVGRVVWQVEDGLAVLPVNYRVIDDSVVFHTGPDSSLAQLTDPTAVAFQVDEIDQDTAVGWSVLVQGMSGLSGEEHSVSFLPRSPSIAVAVSIQQVAGRVISGNPVPQG